MKKLRTINVINSLVIFAYIPYLIIDYNDFFFAKNNNYGLMILSLIMFFITFVCAGSIMVIANRKNVGKSICFNDFKSLDKAETIVLLIVYLVGIIIMLWQVHDEIILFYVAVSTLSFIFIMIERIIIQRIYNSTCYIISLPWYLYPIPFIIFIGGAVLASYTLPEENMGTVIILLFIIAGLMMIYFGFHSDYTVDEKLKTIEKSKYVLFSKLVADKISYDGIKYIRKNGMYYIIIKGNDEMKINRFYSGVKQFEKTLQQNNIIIE